jgi:hypothetical protein
VSDDYRSGDHWVICDSCGFKVRASDTRKRWDGMRVCTKDWETRHPQDYVRGKRDRQAVPDPRPEPPDTFLAPNDVTEADL